MCAACVCLFTGFLYVGMCLLYCVIIFGDMACGPKTWSVVGVMDGDWRHRMTSGVMDGDWRHRMTRGVMGYDYSFPDHAEDLLDQ